jgi:hypothetical protein
MVDLSMAMLNNQMATFFNRWKNDEFSFTIKMVEFTHKCENGGRIAIKNIDENKGAGWFNH